MTQEEMKNKKDRERQKRQDKKDRRESRLREQRQKLEEFNNIFKSNEEWSRYLTISTENIITALELDDYLLNIYATEELSFKNKVNDKSVWIVRTTCREQSKAFLNIKEINGSRVSVTPHADMNSVWGTMILFRDDEEDEERCLRIIGKRHKNVQEVKILKLRTNTKIAKIKFMGKNLPDRIYMGGRRRDLKAYIPKPAQCHKCSKYGHYKNFCNAQALPCYYCGSYEHESQWECGGKAKCVNCHGEHHARSQKCPHYSYNAQVKHLQIRTGMSVRDAKEELKERGIQEPVNQTTYAKKAKQGANKQGTSNQGTSNQGTSNGKTSHQGTSNQGTSNQRTSKQGTNNEAATNEEPRNPETKDSNKEEDIDATQKFQTETNTRRKDEKQTEKDHPQTSNRFAHIGEESLDEMETDDEETTSQGMRMSEMEGFWEKNTSPKTQRKSSKGKHTVGKPQVSKRSRENSPQHQKSAEDKRKQKQSPPNKKSLGIGYSSTSEEDVSVVDEPTEEAREGMPIPTIVNAETVTAAQRERIPNPFRREDIPLLGEHPLRSRSQSPSRQRSDLEGVREELKELYKEKGNQDEVNHTHHCGCGKCFWKEKEKIKQLTEKSVSGLIDRFLEERKPETIPKELQHDKLCMCVICIRKKVEERKEATIREIMEIKNQAPNRDPRTKKEHNQQK